MIYFVTIEIMASKLLQTIITSIFLHTLLFTTLVNAQSIDLSRSETLVKPDYREVVTFDFEELLKDNGTGMINLKPDAYCQEFIFCGISFKTNKKSKVYFGNQTQKIFRIIQLNANENANLTIPNQEGDLIFLQVISQENPVQLIDFKIFQQSQASSLNLLSHQRINWNLQNILKTDEAKGLNGQLIDIVESTELQKGSYVFKYKITKLENFNTGDDLIKISAFNSRGTKVFEEIKDENDLIQNQENLITRNFEMKIDSKIYIFIKFYGNHTGARADIEFGEFILEASNTSLTQ